MMSYDLISPHPIPYHTIHPIPSTLHPISSYPIPTMANILVHPDCLTIRYLYICPNRQLFVFAAPLACTHTKWSHKLDFPSMDWPIADFPQLKYPMDKHKDFNRQEENRAIQTVCKLFKYCDISHILTSHNKMRMFSNIGSDKFQSCTFHTLKYLLL